MCDYSEVEALGLRPKMQERSPPEGLLSSTRLRTVLL
jgi:hypothetical protein